MIDLETSLFLISILVMAIVHTFGEVIYKKGTTSLIKSRKNSFSESFNLRLVLIPLSIIGISLGISLGVRIFYGIILGYNPLSSTIAFFLGSIAIFSIIFGKIFFNEQISSYQLIGIALIVFGILILV